MKVDLERIEWLLTGPLHEMWAAENRLGLDCVEVQEFGDEDGPAVPTTGEVRPTSRDQMAAMFAIAGAVPKCELRLTGYGQNVYVEAYTGDAGCVVFDEGRLLVPNLAARIERAQRILAGRE